MIDPVPEHDPVEPLDEPVEPATSSYRESVRRWIGGTRATLATKYDEARGRRGESAPIDVAFRVIEADRQYAGGLIAGGMAFRIFTVLVPLAFVVVTTFGFVGDVVDSGDPTKIARQIGMTGLVASAIDDSVHASGGTRVLTFVIALYALLWSTWMLLIAVRTVHGLAWDVGATGLKRPWRPVLAVAAAMLASVAAGSAVSRLSDAVAPWAELAIRVLAVGVFVVGWIGISCLLPRAPDTTWRSLVPGAVLVGVGIEVLHLLTVYFFSRYLASKTDTYGMLGAAIAILLWAYILGRLVVTGAFLNAARWRNEQDRSVGSTGT
ncbi:MAG: YhjD/YihY/BrkB family envelope integrity protein [Acidimicrobiia bacterium]